MATQLQDQDFWLVEKLFEEALDQPAEERVAFLDAACADNEALRSQLDGLLKVMERSFTRFLEPQMVEMTREAFGTDTVPEKIGPYRILDQLGQGGMGTVYRAEQSEPIRREVALKLIENRLNNRHAWFRFDTERQAMARMSHPAIAHVYDAGTLSATDSSQPDQPFVVMELVRGEPITDYCDRRELSLDARLEIFRSVCEGIHHAHQKGVLHRDIKPSNVLVSEVGDKPQVKIIDFGIAKALDGPLTEATPTHGTQMIGTPNYLSPESIQRTDAGVDIRADVYSLGILFYELIVGLRPFEAHETSVLHLLLSIVEDEPRRPGDLFLAHSEDERRALARQRSTTPATLLRRVRGDLDWMAARAVAKEREDRYASALEFAADVAHHLRDEPVSAHPRHRLYLARKFVTRYRTGALAVAVAVLLLAVGLTARSLEASRANREARSAQEAEAQAEAVIDFMVEIFNVANPEKHRGEELTARQILDRGAEKLRGSLEDQPRTRARLLRTLAEVYWEIGLYDEAGQQVEQALAVLDGAKASPLETARAHKILADTRWRQGRLDEAAAEYLRALELAEYMPDSALAVSIHNALGGLRTRQGLFDEAESHFKTFQERAAELRDYPMADRVVHLSNYAGFLARRGRLKEAEATLRQAVELGETHLERDHPSLGPIYNNLGLALFDQARLSEAEPFLRRALDVRTKALGAEHPRIAVVLTNLAGLMERTGRSDEAEPLYRRALDVRRTAFDAGHPDIARSRRNLGRCLIGMDRHAEARELFDGVAETLMERYGPQHFEVARTLAGLCLLERAAGELAAALSYCQRAVDIFSQAFGGEHPDSVGALFELAMVHRDLGQNAQASSFLRVVVAVGEKSPEVTAELLVKARRELAVLR